MSKKTITASAVILLVSFFCGLFCEITVQHEMISTAFSFKSYSSYIISCLEKNLAAASAFFIIAFASRFKPMVFLITACKFFSLGFSTAYILYNISEPFTLLLCCIFFECLYTIPVYFVLTEMIFSSSSQIKNVLSCCIFCLSFMTLFSFIQGFLIQLFV